MLTGYGSVAGDAPTWPRHIPPVVGKTRSSMAILHGNRSWSATQDFASLAVQSSGSGRKDTSEIPFEAEVLLRLRFLQAHRIALIDSIKLFWPSFIWDP